MSHITTRTLTSVALIAALAAGTLGAAKPPKSHDPKPPNEEAGDAVVVAVIDWEPFDPYLYDLRADLMPQHVDGTKKNDLPLDRPPHEWLTGFPDPATFASYRAVPVTFPPGPTADQPDGPERWGDFYTADRDAGLWDVERSTADAVQYHWLPGTKVIGALTFGHDGLVQGPKAAYQNERTQSERAAGGRDWHSVLVTSASVGNRHGTCPECLLVYIEIDTGRRETANAAMDWAMDQPWVDAVVNAYGFGVARFDHGRDRVSAAANTQVQLAATVRGQSLFASSGNGLEGSFVVPNQTLLSAMAGPDWAITVGGIDGDESFPPAAVLVNAGLPVDVVSPVGGIPTAHGSSSVGGDSTGGGTSLAVGLVAGYYGRALHAARSFLSGASRSQDSGTIATGRPVDCAPSRPTCEVGDGLLTRDELARRLFGGARLVGLDPADGQEALRVALGGSAPSDPARERSFMREGHGAYLSGLVSYRSGALDWPQEFDAGLRHVELSRITDPMFGRASESERPAGEREWMVVDSYCRQKLWGWWSGGYYVDDVTTPLPAPDPAWPIRTALMGWCLGLPDGAGHDIGGHADTLSDLLWSVTNG